MEYKPKNIEMRCTGCGIEKIQYLVLACWGITRDWLWCSQCENVTLWITKD